MKFAIATAAVLVAAGAASAQVGSVAYTDSILSTRTNWDNVLTFPKFDGAAIGPGVTLSQVTWELTGGVDGDASFESLDAGPTTVTMSLSAMIKLFAPDATPLGVVLPAAATSDDVLAFDGTIDFGGTSGRAYLGLTASDFASASSTEAAFLALFEGVGDVELGVTATGTSTASGAGNLLTLFQTFGAAEVRIKYDYVPAPGAMALLGLGGLVAGRRRR
jgi:hypothetical protein